MTELEKIGAELAKMILSIPTWETGTGRDYFELRKGLWEGIVAKARAVLQMSQEGHRE